MCLIICLTLFIIGGSISFHYDSVLASSPLSVSLSLFSLSLSCLFVYMFLFLFAFSERVGLGGGGCFLGGRGVGGCCFCLL